MFEKFMVLIKIKLNKVFWKINMIIKVLFIILNKMKREGYDSIADLFINDYIENIKNSDNLIEKDNEKKENNNEEETKKESIKDKESNEENKIKIKKILMKINKS